MSQNTFFYHMCNTLTPIKLSHNVGNSKRPGLDFHTGMGPEWDLSLIPVTGTGRNIPGFYLDPGYRDRMGFSNC